LKKDGKKQEGKRERLKRKTMPIAIHPRREERNQKQRGIEIRSRAEKERGERPCSGQGEERFRRGKRDRIR